mmetsp:Transcript_509/g.1208  ORF Transcript_509/g.1208 Transcript_509/m.1208 type:complete len:226 (+) Transcript_509:3268-3945(+)
MRPSAFMRWASLDAAGRREILACEASRALRVSRPDTGMSLMRSTRSPGFSCVLLCWLEVLGRVVMVLSGTVVTSQYGVVASWMVKSGMPPFSITSVTSVLSMIDTLSSSIEDTGIPSTEMILSPSWHSRSSLCTLLIVRSGRSFMLRLPLRRGTPHSNCPKLLSRYTVSVGVLSSAFRNCTGDTVSKSCHSAAWPSSFLASTPAIIALPARWAEMSLVSASTREK